MYCTSHVSKVETCRASQKLKINWAINNINIRQLLASKQCRCKYVATLASPNL